MYNVFLFIFLSISLISGCEEMNSTPPPVSGKWAEVLKAPSKELTEYVKQHPLHLENVLLKHQSLSRSEIQGARFVNVYWDDSFAQNALIQGTLFKGGVIYDTSFADSTFSNVVFDGVTMDKAEFVAAKLTNVTFKNCKIYNSEIRNLRDSTFRIENCEMSDTNFFHSKMDLEIINSTGIKLLDFSGAHAGSRLLIKGSTIGRRGRYELSNFDEFIIESSKLEKNSAGDMKAATLRIVNTDAGITFRGGDYQSVLFDNTKDAMLWESRIGTATIKNLDPGEMIDLEDIKAGKVFLSNSTVLRTLFDRAVVDELHLTNFRTDELNFTDAKIRKLVLHNVTVTQKADFSNLQVEEPVIEGFHAAQGAQVITAGSNLKQEQLR